MDMATDLKAAEAVARSVAHMLDEIEAAFVVVWAENETIARLLGKVRIDVPILVLCPNLTTAQQLSMNYGVVCVQHGAVGSYDEWIEVVEAIVVENGWATKGQRLLLMPPKSALSENTAGAIIMHTIA
jgi:pyruvate kinase